MTRIREETELHGHGEGIRRGLSATGGVITSAGIVLAATFATFVAMPVVDMVQFGVVVGLGVLIDTFLVRTLLVPALSLDIGRAIWWPGELFMRLRRSSDPAPLAGRAQPVGLASAVRMTMGPAVTSLLGRSARWSPNSWLGRALPNGSVEGTGRRGRLGDRPEPLATVPDSRTQGVADRTENGWKIAGQVRGRDGQPALAVLTLTDQGGRQISRTRTDSGGAYLLQPPTSGTYLLVCTPGVGAGYEPVAGRVTVYGSMTHDIRLGS